MSTTCTDPIDCLDLLLESKRNKTNKILYCVHCSSLLTFSDIQLSIKCKFYLHKRIHRRLCYIDQCSPQISSLIHRRTGVYQEQNYSHFEDKSFMYIIKSFNNAVSLYQGCTERNKLPYFFTMAARVRC